MGKKLGQHFLKSKLIIDILINESDLNKDDIVLEIGGGKGAITKHIVDKCKKLIVLEKDIDLFEHLQEKFFKEIKEKRIKLIHCDARDNKWLEELPKKYKILANIPYYITGSFLRKMLEIKNPPQQIVILAQKEIVKRIAKDKKESLLSLSVKFFGTPKYVKTVSKKAFSPPPKVDSAILSIKDITPKKDSIKFFNLIHTAFQSKRKTVLKKFDEKTQKKLIKLGIKNKDRAEDISIDIWQSVIEN